MRSSAGDASHIIDAQRSQPDNVYKLRVHDAKKRMKHFQAAVSKNLALSEKIFSNLGSQVERTFFVKSEGLSPVRISFRIGGKEYGDGPIVPRKAVVMPLKTELVKSMITEFEDKPYNETIAAKLTHFKNAGFLITDNGEYILALMRGRYEFNPHIVLGTVVEYTNEELLIPTGGDAFEYILNVESQTKTDGNLDGQLELVYINPERTDVIDVLLQNGEQGAIEMIDLMREHKHDK